MHPDYRSCRLATLQTPPKREGTRGGAGGVYHERLTCVSHKEAPVQQLPLQSNNRPLWCGLGLVHLVLSLPHAALHHHSSIHSFTHSLTHSLIHSFICSFRVVKPTMII